MLGNGSPNFTNQPPVFAMMSTPTPTSTTTMGNILMLTLGNMGEIEKSINNDFRNSNSLCGYDESERYDYSINHALLSDIVNINPTMSNPQNNSLAAGLNGGEGSGLSNESDMGEHEEQVVGAPSPYNGSKSLVTGKRGFSPYFKSLAVAELHTHCSHQSLFTKALTVTESKKR